MHTQLFSNHIPVATAVSKSPLGDLGAAAPAVKAPFRGLGVVL